MSEPKDLVPDQQILAAITGISPPKGQTYDIISNTFDTCTFRLKLEGERPKGYPADLIVRLEASENRLAQVATLQRLGHLQLPDVVPETLNVGIVKDASGRQLEYSISSYVEGTSTLEDIWDTISRDDQQYLIDSVIGAITKLHGLNLQSEDVRQRLLHLQPEGNSEKPLEPLIGGPELGYHANIAQLLEAFAGGVGSDTQGYKIEQTQGGIAVQSIFADIGAIELSQADLDALKENIVLCHNDLEPRNILVRQCQPDSEGNSAGYQVAAIIDWEMAGFYPFAFEFGFKDTVLGSSNLYLSWYLLFKERAARRVPEGSCHSKLIKAMTTIGRSKTRAKKRTIGFQFQRKWIERHGLSLLDERRGWVPGDGVENPVFTKEDKENLEHEVLKELGYI